MAFMSVVAVEGVNLIEENDRNHQASSEASRRARKDPRVPITASMSRGLGM